MKKYVLNYISKVRFKLIELLAGDYSVAINLIIHKGTVVSRGKGLHINVSVVGQDLCPSCNKQLIMGKLNCVKDYAQGCYVDERDYV